MRLKKRSKWYILFGVIFSILVFLSIFWKDKGDMFLIAGLSFFAIGLGIFSLYFGIMNLKHYLNINKENSYFEGNIQGANIFIAPFSRVKSVWFRVIIKWWGFDSSDHMNRLGWHLLCDDTQKNNLVLNSSSKNITIENAEFDINKSYTYVPRSKLEFPESKLREFLVNNNYVKSDEILKRNKYWIKEYYIEPNERLQLINEKNKMYVSDHGISKLKSRFFFKFISTFLLGIGLVLIGSWLSYAFIMMTLEYLKII